MISEIKCLIENQLRLDPHRHLQSTVDWQVEHQCYTMVWNPQLSQYKIAVWHQVAVDFKEW
jgi:hypothetical protein